MSHFTTISTIIVSSMHLVRALKDVGFKEVEVHAVPQPLYGFEGSKRAQKGHVIVRRKYVGYASNDIGFVQNAKGVFDAMISEFDSRKYGQDWLWKLTQRYAYHVTTDKLTQQNFSLVHETREPDGTIRLTLRRSM